MTILTDWQGLKAGTGDPDFFIFADLLRAHPADEDLELLFGDLPKGDALIARIRQLRRENTMNGMYVVPDPANAISEPIALGLVDRYSQSVAWLLAKTAPDIAHEPLSSKVQIVRDNETFLDMADKPDLGLSEADDFIQYAFDQHLDRLGNVRFGLWEAVYALTNYPVVTRWLLEEMIDFPMSSGAYYELWRGGGDVTFLRDGKLVLVEG